MKRLLLWSVAISLVVSAAVALAFRLSPWPSVAVISYLFSRSDRASEAALAKHVPPGIVSRLNVAYGAGKDEVFDLYYPQETSPPRPAIVWVHGGGFVAGSKEGIANYMRVLAGRGYATIAVGYSRGRRGTYPKPVEQVNAALGFLDRHAADLGIEPTALVLAGSSAGAHIASQVAMITTDPAYATAIGIAPRLRAGQLSATLLLSGAFDPGAVNLEGSYGWFLRTVMWAYLGMRHFDEDERFRLISVTGNVTGAFPPSFVSSGNGDPLVEQAVALARRLESLGVHVQTLFFPPDRDPPLPHEYQFNLDDPAGREALDRMTAFLRAVRTARAAAVPGASAR